MERRLPLNARLRAVLNMTRSRPPGCRQPAWTWTDRLIIRHLAWRQYGPEGRGPHLVWE